MLHNEQNLEGVTTEFFSHVEPELFASRHSIHFPLPDSGPLKEKVPSFNPKTLRQIPLCTMQLKCIYKWYHLLY